MTPDEKRIRQKLKDDFIHYARKCLKIRTKSGRIEPFELNKAQLHIYQELERQKGETSKVRALVLKGRQQGVSTLIGGRFYHQVSHHFGMQAFILTHALDATQNLYKMAQRYYENTPSPVKPQVSTSNAKELIFGDLDSGYKLGTAENKAVGRSATIQFLHGCLGMGTRLYDPCTGGLKNIEEFIVGDEVLTHTGNHAKISFISSQKKDCLSIKFRGLTKFPLIVTPEHRFWTKEGWKEASNLNIGDSIGYPIKKICEKCTVWVLPPATKRAHGGGRQLICPDSINLDYNFGRIVGLYLADGHIKLQYKPPNQPSLISFAVHRKEVDRTMEWLTPFKSFASSIKVVPRQDSLTTEIIFYGNRLVMLINNMCGRTIGKHFPHNWENTNKEFILGMIHGYLAGDGSSYVESRRIRATSICSALTVTMRDMCASLGFGWASIEHKEAAIRSGRNEKEAFIFSLCGDGVNEIAASLNKPAPKIIRPKTSSTKEFAANTTEISNGYAWIRIREIESVGIKNVYDFEIDHEDHSYCILQGATHNSECAFWNNASEHAKGIMQAVPNAPGTEIILESTANGVGNYFHQMWQSAESGQSDFRAIFVPWFWQDEYQIVPPADFHVTEDEQVLMEQYDLNINQLAWRRSKIVDLSVNGTDGEKSFKQEYPNNPTEAFQLTGEDTYIYSSLVMSARKSEAERVGKLVIGVDPARFGDDRTAIIRRQGRVAFGLEHYIKKDTMEIVGIVHSIIEKESPDKVFVDIGGLGAGVYDRLIELGHKRIVVAVNAGATPLNAKIYSNKRSEMWGLLKQWLEDTPCQIPDDDALHADICGIRYKIDSNSRLVMEQKAEMKKRGIRSPDCADALCLTFAQPASALTDSSATGKIAANIMQNNKKLRQAKDYLYGGQGFGK